MQDFSKVSGGVVTCQLNIYQWDPATGANRLLDAQGGCKIFYQGSDPKTYIKQCLERQIRFFGPGIEACLDLEKEESNAQLLPDECVEERPDVVTGASGPSPASGTAPNTDESFRKESSSDGESIDDEDGVREDDGLSSQKAKALWHDTMKGLSRVASIWGPFKITDGFQQFTTAFCMYCQTQGGGKPQGLHMDCFLEMQRRYCADDVRHLREFQLIYYPNDDADMHTCLQRPKGTKKCANSFHVVICGRILGFMREYVEFGSKNFVCSSTFGTPRGNRGTAYVDGPGGGQRLAPSNKAFRTFGEAFEHVIRYAPSWDSVKSASEADRKNSPQCSSRMDHWKKAHAMYCNKKSKRKAEKILRLDKEKRPHAHTTGVRMVEENSVSHFQEKAGTAGKVRAMTPREVIWYWDHVDGLNRDCLPPPGCEKCFHPPISFRGFWEFARSHNLAIDTVTDADNAPINYVPCKGGKKKRGGKRDKNKLHDHVCVRRGTALHHAGITADRIVTELRRRQAPSDDTKKRRRPTDSSSSDSSDEEPGSDSSTN